MVLRYKHHFLGVSIGCPLKGLQRRVSIKEDSLAMLWSFTCMVQTRHDAYSYDAVVDPRAVACVLSF